ncbi:MAG: Hsp33 family molecular chaperone HslO [Lachnospiraceae bacterium]|nr:Hsp33 family molecular chaperone HslO [Lachnospiraceae bacterium]
MRRKNVLDYIVRGTAANGAVRVFAADTTGITEYARNCHDTSPVATAALGRLLCAGTMMGNMMKGDRDLLTLQVKGDGPLGDIVVTADSHGSVKGYVHHPHVIIPANEKGKLDVSGAVGHGILQVIQDLGLKDPYVGSVALQTGEIAEDLTYYFASSEQVPSAVGLGVLMNRNNTVRCSGGFIIQLMPFTPDAVADTLEKNLAGVSSVTTMLAEGKTPEQILGILTEGLELEIIEKKEVAYRCDCSKERFTRGLISLGKKELKKMAADREPIEICCHFCNKRYIFSPEEIRALAQR